MSGWEDLDHEIDKITSDLHKIADATEDFIKDKKNGKPTNDRRVKEVNKLIAQLRIRMNSLELEIREAQSYVNPRVAARQKEALKDLKREFKETKQRWEDVRSGSYRGDLGLSNLLTGPGAAEQLEQGMAGRQEQNERFAQMDLKTAGKEGDRIQSSTKGAVQRGNNQLREAEEVGERALTRLQEQGEQLDTLDGKLDEVDENVEINKALLMEIAKASVKDKLIQLLCAVFTIAIITMIVIVATKPPKTT